MNPHLKLNRYVYFLPKKYKKFQKGKIIYITNDFIGIKWKKGIVEFHYKYINLLYENFYRYYDYLEIIPSHKKNKIRYESKLFDDLLIENFNKFSENERIKTLIKDIENSLSKSIREIRILYHYLKIELREISFEFFNLSGVYDNPVDRAKNLKKLRKKLKNI